MDAPALDDGLEFFYFAYQDLATCVYFAGGMIPWTAINEYGKEAKLSSFDRSELAYVINSLDLEMIEYHRSKQPSQGKRGKTK